MGRKCIWLVVVPLIIAIPSTLFATGYETNWKEISGKWIFDGKEVCPDENYKQEDDQFLCTRKDLTLGSHWEALSVDFQLKDINNKFGVLLNYNDESDYQLLRISNSGVKTVVQMLRWQYGYFRLWQEALLDSTLFVNTTYCLEIEKAPLVDREDWREWKIIIKEKDSGKVLLKQGVDNEQPAFGQGVVGLFSEKTEVLFSGFRIDSKYPLLENGALTLAPVFKDHMVLQQGKEINVWGKYKANQNVKIRIGEETYKVISDEFGNWSLVIPPLNAQTCLEIKITTQDANILIKDVAVGEVWFASGQSNMEMRAWQTDVAESVSELDESSDLRFFLQPNWPAPYPKFNSGGEWLIADSANALGFSAVALRFAVQLQRKLKVTVGIISSNWGGTAIESWLPDSALKSDSQTVDIAKQMDQFQQALEKGEPINVGFPDNWNVPGQRHTPGYLYNGMVYPHSKFSIRGFIWYQGESNANKAYQYEALFKMLISSWREVWQDPELHFLCVQLAGYGGNQSGANIKNAWPQIREAQRVVLNEFRNTGMATAIDLEQGDNIHPKYKKEIGDRLARLALVDVYKFEGIVRSSPLFVDFALDADAAIVNFSNVGEGLEITDGKSLRGFVIAGKNKEFVEATAIIRPDGKSIKVYNKNVKEPVAVRYAWKNNPIDANLGNSDGLPAVPFRTDNWILFADED